MADREHKLGYLVPEFPTQTHIFFSREVNALRAAGVQLQLFSTTQPAEPCKHAFAAEAIRETIYLFPPGFLDGVELACSVTRWPKLISYMLKVTGGREIRKRLKIFGMVLCAARLNRIARGMSVTHVHAHSCADVAHLVAMAKLLGGPTYSLTLHGCLENYGTHHKEKMEGATCITSAGNHLVEEIVANVGVPREKLRSVPMGLDTTRFTPMAEKFNETTYGAKPDQRVTRIAMVARLGEGKGHQFAIEAIDRLVKEGRSVQLVAAGSGPNEGALKELAGSRGLLGKEIIFAGSLSEDQILDLVQKADIVILPSYGSFEAYPVAVMEAMSCGVAVVVSSIGATTEMISDGHDGFLVEKRDVDGLTAALRRLVDDPDLRRRIGRNARDRAIRQFDVRQTSKALISFIHEHLGRR